MCIASLVYHLIYIGLNLQITNLHTRIVHVYLWVMNYMNLLHMPYLSIPFLLRLFLMKILPSNQLKEDSRFDAIFFINEHTYKYGTNKVLMKSVIPSYYYETKIKRIYKS